MRRLAIAAGWCAPAILVVACNAMLGIEEAGPIQGSGGDASAGSSGSGGSSGATGGVGGTGGNGGSAGSGGIVDAGNCDADVVSDRNNCGACGHSCNGDDCAAGKCVPKLVQSVPYSLYFLTLSPDQIFASATYGSAIVRIPKANPVAMETWAVTQPGNDSFSPVVVSGQDVYFSHIEGRTIHRAGVSAIGSPQTIYTDPADDYTSDVVADASGVYFSVCSTGIWKVATPAQLISPTPSCAYRTANDTDAIWATSATEGRLYRVPKASGGSVAEFTVAPAATDTYALAVGATHVYFATYEEVAGTTDEYASRLYRVAKSAPSNTPPESLQAGATFATINEMTVADGFLYFVSTGTHAAAYKDGRVLRVPLTDPNQAPEVVVANRHFPLGIAVDEQFVYWIDALESGWGPVEIWRVAR